MRVLLSLALCSAIAVPGAALAQAIPNLQPPLATPPLAPLPTVQPTVEAPAPIASKPPPARIEAAPAPELPSAPATVVPVLVPKEEKDSGVAGMVGVVVGGVAGGAAGAAVGGPVGKFAGGFLGKRIVKGVFGVGKDKLPEVTVAEVPPSAEGAARPAVASPATAPPLKETASTAPSTS